MRDHRSMPYVGICLLALAALLIGAAGATGASAPAPAASTTVAAHASAAKTPTAAQRKARAHKRARHARVCRRAHRRAAISRFAHRRAIRCDRQAKRAMRRRAAIRQRRHRAAERRATALQPSVPTTRDTTSPAATATAARGSAQGWNGFGPGSWPGADWRPYAASSPLNQPVANAAVHPRSAAIVGKVLSWGSPQNLFAGSAGTTSDYAHPTYYAQPTDPLFTLHATESRNAIEGTRIRIPDAARPAGGSDGHMTVVQPDGWEYDFWQVQSKPKGGGTLTFAIGGRIRIDGDGLRAPATASNFGNLGGIIRAQELAAGHIDHALFLVVKCTTTSTSFGYGTVASDGDPAYVYPATHAGSSCGSSDDADAPPMGARFQLAMSDAQIDALNVPAWKKTIARALAHYGGYVGDTGGEGFALQFESSTMYTSLGTGDPLVAFAQQNGISPNGGLYPFNLSNGIDWARYLRVVVPPGR